MVLVLQNKAHSEEAFSTIVARGGSCLERVTVQAMSESGLDKEEGGAFLVTLMNNMASLHVAGQNGNLGALSAFIKGGAPVDYAPQPDKYTALTYAVTDLQLDAVKLLLLYGAAVTPVIMLIAQKALQGQGKTLGKTADGEDMVLAGRKGNSSPTKILKVLQEAEKERAARARGVGNA